jgi:hypothetical protein
MALKRMAREEGPVSRALRPSHREHPHPGLLPLREKERGSEKGRVLTGAPFVFPSAGSAYLQLAAKRWMRLQASSSTFSLVA